MNGSDVPQTLSLCMIVRDEERFLPECLESVKSVVNQMVVVDTGSTDKTVQIAKEVGAEVYHFDWEDDFARARNYSLRFARGEWILWMDADERLAPESIPVLHSLLVPEGRPVIYRVQIRNLLADGKNYSLSSAHRLFNNHQHISFSGRIHEQVSPSAAARNGDERESHVILHHLGYALDGEIARRKDRRNRNLLEKMVKESPRSAYAHYTLAQHYGLTGEFSRAVKHYRSALGLNQFDPPMRASLFNALGESLYKLEKFGEARKACNQSLRITPLQAAGHYLLYKIAYDEKDYDGALHALEILITNTRRLTASTKTISTDILIDLDKLSFAQAELFSLLGKPQAALPIYKHLSAAHPDHRQVLEKLAEVSSQLNDFSLAESTLQHLIETTGDRARYLQPLGNLYIRQRKFDEAISVYESLALESPEDQAIIHRLAGLYAKVGKRGRAESLVMAIQEM